MKRNTLLGVFFILNYLMSFAQEEEAFLAPPVGDGQDAFIDFVGTGNLQSSLSQGDDIQGSAGLGVIFERYNGQDILLQSFDMEGIINVAATVDTVKVKVEDQQITNIRDFGGYVLNPFTTKQSLFVNANLYFNPTYYKDKDPDKFLNTVFNVISGVNFRVISSNSVWEVDRDKNVSNLGVVSARAGIFHEFLPNNKIRDDKNRVKHSVILGVNYSYRGIFGDFSSDQNAEARREFLGTDRTHFRGLELNFGFRLNNIRAEFQMPFLSSNDDSSINGLTDTQFMFSIRFVGGFTLKLND